MHVLCIDFRCFYINCKCKIKESEFNMRIQCEFCNTTYESKEHEQCPNCGAATGENKAVQEQIKRDQENRQKIEARQHPPLNGLTSV